MAYEKKPDELGALWVKTDQKGRDYMTGEINGEKVVVFASGSQGEKAPAWRVYKARPKTSSGSVEH